MRGLLGLLLLGLVPGCELLFAPHDPTGGPPDALPSRTWRTTSTGTGTQRCAIDTDGGLWCWGRGVEGQVGDGMMLDRASRVPIEAAATWVAVATGFIHTCALRSDATVWCWGSGEYGELGDGRRVSSPVAVRVVDNNGTRRWTHLAVGASHACAINEDQSLWCWGFGFYGQIGNGANDAQPTPVKIGSSTWTAIAAGGAHTCGIQTDGSLWCWGLDGSGQLGDGMTTNTNTPGPVPGAPTSWTAVAAGNSHTCGITGGHLLCWGGGTHGELGDDTRTTRLDPVEVNAPGAPWTAITCGDFHTCGIREDRTLWCWGDDRHGELGDGDETGMAHLRPAQVGTGVLWTMIGAGQHDTCGVTDAATLLCTGENAYGTLGDGLGGARTAPSHVIDNADAIASGDNHSCALVGQTTYCWGSNANAQVDPSGLDRQRPVVPTALAARSVAAGDAHTCEVLLDGSMWCWGDDSMGALGNGAGGAGSAPVRVVGADGWLDVDASQHTCSRHTSTKEVYCWGRNAFGQVGNNSTGMELEPVSTVGPLQADAVAVGWEHTCAIREDGALLCWGGNGEDQLGNPSGGDQHTPTQVGIETSWSKLDLGGFHSCAIKNDGTLWCWGWGGLGQLGDGSTANHGPPAPVTGQWAAVSGGFHHTCGVRGDATLACWGEGTWGKLGTGDTTTRLHATTVLGMNTWLAVAAGTSHTCGLDTDHSVWCWGNNAWGQVGDGSAWRSAFAPVP